MVHTLPVKGKSAMLNIAEQLGIRNARRNGFRPYRTRNNSRGSSAEETAAGQCRRLAGHGPVSITGRREGYGWRYHIRRLHSRFGSGPVWFLAESRAIGCVVSTTCSPAVKKNYRKQPRKRRVGRSKAGLLFPAASSNIFNPFSN